MHPDRPGGTKVLFELVSDAWETLSDPAARARYDADLRGTSEPPAAAPARSSVLSVELVATNLVVLVAVGLVASWLTEASLGPTLGNWCAHVFAAAIAGLVVAHHLWRLGRWKLLGMAAVIAALLAVAAFLARTISAVGLPIDCIAYAGAAALTVVDGVLAGRHFMGHHPVWSLIRQLLQLLGRSASTPPGQSSSP